MDASSRSSWSGRREYYGDKRGRGPWGGSWRDEPAARAAPPTFAHMPPGARPRGGRRRTAAPPRAKPGEITVDYDADASASGPGLQVGAKLRHPSFGVGEMRGWQGAGADLKVTMRFPGAGVKTILARFLSKP